MQTAVSPRISAPVLLNMHQSPGCRLALSADLASVLAAPLPGSAFSYALLRQLTPPHPSPLGPSPPSSCSGPIVGILAHIYRAPAVHGKCFTWVVSFKACQSHPVRYILFKPFIFQVGKVIRHTRVNSRCPSLGPCRLSGPSLAQEAGCCSC